MADTQKTFLLHCAYSDCGKETKIILPVPARRRGKKRRKSNSCATANTVSVPTSSTFPSPGISVRPSSVTITRFYDGTMAFW